MKEPKLYDDGVWAIPLEPGVDVKQEGDQMRLDGEPYDGERWMDTPLRTSFSSLCEYRRTVSQGSRAEVNRLKEELAVLKAQKQELIEINHNQHDQSAVVYCELEKRLTATELMLKFERKLSRASHRQPQEWISLAERKPTAEDGDKYGQVVFICKGITSVDHWTCYPAYERWYRMPRFTPAPDPDSAAFEQWWESTAVLVGTSKSSLWDAWQAAIAHVARKELDNAQ